MLPAPQGPLRCIDSRNAIAQRCRWFTACRRCRRTHSLHPMPLLLQAQKGQLRSQLDVASKARESARSSMKELRSSLKFTKGGCDSVPCFCQLGCCMHTWG